MAIEITPLGFQKPDGYELVRNGDNAISANAAKAQELHASAQGRLGAIETKNATQDTDIANARTGATADAKSYTDAQVAVDRGRLDALDGKVWFKGYLPNGTDLNTYAENGRWAVRLTSDVATIVNAPVGAGPGFVELTTSAHGMKVQTWVNYLDGKAWRRVTQSIASNTFLPWGALDVDAKAYADAAVAADRTRLTAIESAAYMPAWKPSTAYLAGQSVIAPNGDVVSAKVNFTSGASYSATNWNASTQDGRIGAIEALRALPYTTVANGTDVNTLRTPGRYLVNSNTVSASLLNGASTNPAVITVEAGTTGLISQIWTEIFGTTNAVFKRTTSALTPTPFPYGPWESMRVRAYTNLTTGTDLNTLTTPGKYLATSNTIAASLINAPSGVGAGVVEVENTGTGVVAQTWTNLYGDVLGKYTRKTNNISTNPFGFSAWMTHATLADITSAPAAEPNHALSHATLAEAFIRRQGGTIGTAGKPVVSIRVDHGLVNFRDKILPLLRTYRLPASIALCSDGMSLPENTGVTWADVQGWALNDGIDPWNHARNHSDTTGYANLWDKIAGAKTALQGYMPDSPIDKWIQPGVGGTNYGGYNGGVTTDLIAGTDAGRIIYGQHAIISGSQPGALEVLDGNPHTGFSYYLVENSTSGVAAVLDRAKAAVSGVTLFFHPSLIDTPGYSTTAQLEAMFADIAARRDAGELLVLSVGGAQIADARHGNRQTLTRNGDFAADLSQWSGSGYTWNSGKATTTTGGLLSQATIFADSPNAKGSVREAVMRVTAPTGAVVRLHVEAKDNPALMSTTVDMTLSAGQTVDVRKFFQIPLSATDILVSGGRVSGGAIEIESIHVLAA